MRIAWVMFLLAVLVWPVAGDQVRYSPPDLLALSIEALAGARHNVGTLTVHFECLAIPLHSLLVHFEVSDDLRVAPAARQIRVIKPGQKRSFRISFKSVAGQSPETGSWVRARVVYHPDQEKLLHLIRQDLIHYPDDDERVRLLDHLRIIGAIKVPHCDAIRFFPKEALR